VSHPTDVEAPVVSPVLLPAQAWEPPGRWFYLSVLVLLLVVAEASSRASWMPFFIAGTIGIIVAALWLFRFVPTLVHRRLRLSGRGWLQWAGIPAILLGTWMLFVSGLAFEVRLALSRAGMEEAASAILTDDEASPGWIGLYPVDRIDRFDGGFRFLIWGSGFIDPLGFVYVVEGEPPIIGEDISQQIDANWWHWQESF